MIFLEITEEKCNSVSYIIETKVTLFILHGESGTV